MTETLKVRASTAGAVAQCQKRKGRSDSQSEKEILRFLNGKPQTIKYLPRKQSPAYSRHLIDSRRQPDACLEMEKSRWRVSQPILRDKGRGFRDRFRRERRSV